MIPERRKTVRIAHRLNAPVEQAFDAWIDPEIACQWLFSTDTGKIVKCEIDARVGGTFTIVDRRPDGDAEHVGTYVEIDRPRRLAFDFGVPKYSPDKTRIIVTIKPIDVGSELTLTSDNVQPEFMDRTVHGWTTLLSRLEKTLNAESKSHR